MIYRISLSMATTVKDNNISDLPEVLVATNYSTTSITNLTVAGSSVPFGIFAFLSNFAIIVTALIIYMKKFLDCDWLKGMQFLFNTVQKKGNLVQKRVTNVTF